MTIHCIFVELFGVGHWTVENGVLQKHLRGPWLLEPNKQRNYFAIERKFVFAG